MRRKRLTQSPCLEAEWEVAWYPSCTTGRHYAVTAKVKDPNSSKTSWNVYAVKH